MTIHTSPRPSNKKDDSAQQSRIMDQLANYVSKGELDELRKERKKLYETFRPGIPLFEYVPQQSNKAFFQLPYYIEQEVSVFADITQKICDETFRMGIEWVPKFAKKCPKCETEYKDRVFECKACGNTKLIEPDKKQLKNFERMDGTSYLDKANYNGQCLADILKYSDKHVTISDNGHILIIKKYKLSNKGEIEASLPVEFIGLDTRDVQYLFDEYGRIGHVGKICLEHREGLYDMDEETCKCGKKLYPAWYLVQSVSAPTRYYTEFEMLRGSFYTPTMLYGQPKILRHADIAWICHYIEKRERSYFEYARNTGILFIPTTNSADLMESWLGTMKQINDDPHTIPVVGVSDSAPTAANLIKLIEDPSQDMMMVYEKNADMLISAFGLTMTFFNNTSNSGGLKNDENLTDMGDRTIKSRIEFHNRVFLKPIAQMFQITDWELKIVSHIEKNQMRTEEVRAQKFNNAVMAKNQLGLKVEYEEGEFIYSEMSPEEKEEEMQTKMKEQQMMMPPQQNGEGANEKKGGKAPFQAKKPKSEF